MFEKCNEGKILVKLDKKLTKKKKILIDFSDGQIRSYSQRI